MSSRRNETTVTRLSKEAENAADGAFDAAYSGNGQSGWFVKVKPVFGTKGVGIDHVVFSFVNKGTSGTDSFDIYIGIRKFRGWCLRIRRGDFFTDLEKEREKGEKFPVMYKIQTGEKGNKVMGFMLSNTPGMVVVNAKDKDHSYVNIPLEYGFLENLAEDFLESSKGRFMELLGETMTAANAYRASLSEEDKEYVEEVKEKSKAPAEEESAANISSEIEVEGFWAVANGSLKESRGKDGSATMLRLVIPTISDSDPGILPNSPAYQLVDCVFYENSLKRANMVDVFGGILERIEKANQAKLQSMKFKVGDIRDGYRQLIFQAK